MHLCKGTNIFKSVNNFNPQIVLSCFIDRILTRFVMTACPQFFFTFAFQGNMQSRTYLILNGILIQQRMCKLIVRYPIGSVAAQLPIIYLQIVCNVMLNKPISKLYIDADTLFRWYFFKKTKALRVSPDSFKWRCNQCEPPPNFFTYKIANMYAIGLNCNNNGCIMNAVQIVAPLFGMETCAIVGIFDALPFFCCRIYLFKLICHYHIFFNNFTPNVPRWYNSGLQICSQRPCSTKLPPNSALKSRTPYFLLGIPAPIKSNNG